MAKLKNAPENLIWQQFVCAREITSEELSEIENSISLLPNDFSMPFNSFVLAMRAISDAACLPFNFSMRQAFQIHHRIAFVNLIHKYEKLGHLPNETREDAIKRISMSASKELSETQEEWTKDKVLTDRFLREVSENLLFNIDGKSNDAGAKEIRYQALVSIWSALEVLIKDELILILNRYPILIKQLIDHEQAKKYFSIPKLDWESLESYGYDLSGKMGDVIFKSKDVSDLIALKYAIKSLFGNSDIYNILNDEDIRLLNLQRHLIVHKRGVCDEKYCNSAEDVLKIGEAIMVSPALIIKYFQKVSHVGLLMLHALNDLIKKTKSL